MQNEARAHSPRRRSSFIIHHSSFPRRFGFTLTELLIVIGIITVVALIAVPSFRAMSGGRSTEAAHNQLSAVLGRVRGEAISLQEVRGLAFFTDPNGGDRIQAMVVRQAQYPTNPPVNPPDIFIDLADDHDPVPLPVGVGLQMVDDCNVNDNATPLVLTDDVRGDDAYIGFNKATNVNGVDITYGGVILFDGYGRIVTKRYGFKLYLEVTTGVTTVKVPSNLAKMLNMTTVSTDYLPPSKPAPLTTPVCPTSQFGFVLYDQEAFNAQGFTLGDPQMDATIDGGIYTDTPAASRSLEAKEERWLDANSRPELVNRNNGTLVTGG